MAVTRPRSTGKVQTITTASVTPVSLFSIPLADGDVIKVKVGAVGKQLTTGDRALFEREGLFYRSGGQVYIEGKLWHTTHTIRSANGFDILYSLTPSTVDIKVKNANPVSTKWVGRLEYDVL